MKVDLKCGQELEASSSHHLPKGVTIQNFSDFDKFCIPSLLDCISLSISGACSPGLVCPLYFCATPLVMSAMIPGREASVKSACT